MSDLLSNLVGGGWPLLVGWLFPSGIAVSLYAFLVLPALDRLPQVRALLELSEPSRAVAIGCTAVGLGLLLSALQTPLYRLLEGYYWPEGLQRRRIQHYVTRKARLAQRKHALDQDGRVQTALQAGFRLEQMRRYPIDDTQVASTRLANSIRAFETYAFAQFKLDSQALWSELVAVAPEQLRANQERARAGVDFFVSLFYLSGLFGVTSLAFGLSGLQPLKLCLIGIAALFMMISWYWLAITGTDSWASTVRALVNLGRKPLAEALGLVLPADLELERRMWQRVNWLTKYPYHPQLAAELAPFAAGRATENANQLDDARTDQAQQSPPLRSTTTRGSRPPPSSTL
jgi:hypothetical protein